jgi:hypothetical protein
MICGPPDVLKRAGSAQMIRSLPGWMWAVPGCWSEADLLAFLPARPRSVYYAAVNVFLKRSRAVWLSPEAQASRPITPVYPAR